MLHARVEIEKQDLYSLGDDEKLLEIEIYICIRQFGGLLVLSGEGKNEKKIKEACCSYFRMKMQISVEDFRCAEG